MARSVFGGPEGYMDAGAAPAPYEFDPAVRRSAPLRRERIKPNIFRRITPSAGDQGQLGTGLHVDANHPRTLAASPGSAGLLKGLRQAGNDILGSRQFLGEGLLGGLQIPGK